MRCTFSPLCLLHNKRLITNEENDQKHDNQIAICTLDVATLMQYNRVCVRYVCYCARVTGLRRFRCVAAVDLHAV